MLRMDSQSAVDGTCCSSWSRTGPFWLIDIERLAIMFYSIRLELYPALSWQKSSRSIWRLLWCRHAEHRYAGHMRLDAKP